MTFHYQTMIPINADGLPKLKAAALVVNSIKPIVGIGEVIKTERDGLLVTIGYNDVRDFFSLGVLYGKARERKK